jgi:HSP20 family molecular chaperone IbpA
MNRYYSDSNDAYYASHQQSNNIRASGWQSPLPSTDITPSLSSTLIRIVVPCPFGSKKCDYTIDKSQQGRLNITARRRHTFKSDYLLLNNKNNTAIQTFLIPNDADVDHLQSHIERYTNRLIIQMPRLHPTYTNLIRSPNIFASAIGTTPLIRDDTKYIRKHADNNRKLEYRVDCRGYTSDELDVFIQGRDLIVQGKTKRATSPDPTGQHVSKNFSRKISLPNTVDLSRIVSYLENGELRIEAPLKRDIHYRDEKILSPELSSTVVGNRTVGEFTRVQSPTPGQQQYHYRRHQRVSRHQGDDHRPQSPTRRIHSAESHHYPYYRSPRDLDEDDARDTRHRRTVNYERYGTNQDDIEQVPIHRSNYSPGNNVVTTRTTYHNHPMEDDTSFNY